MEMRNLPQMEEERGLILRLPNHDRELEKLAGGAACRLTTSGPDNNSLSFSHHIVDELIHQSWPTKRIPHLISKVLDWFINLVWY